MLRRLAVEQALGRLDPRQRLVIRYTYWWGFPQSVQMRRLNANEQMIYRIGLQAKRRLEEMLR